MEHDNLIIAGVGKASGGIYDQVNIEGVGGINDNIECNQLTLSGTCKVRGNIKTESANINGVIVIFGHLQAAQARINGKATVKGNLTGEDIRMRGSVTIKGNCEVESFVCEGAFTIDGFLNAGNTEIRLHGPSRVREIGGETIHVSKVSGAFYRMLKSMLSPFTRLPIFVKLSVEIIEGDEIYLESTNADIVRGNHITIGPDCRIGRVEYKGSFHRVKETKVVEFCKL